MKYKNFQRKVDVSLILKREVNNLQNIFEDAIDVLEKEELGILSLVVFGGGRKEWHWYVRILKPG